MSKTNKSIPVLATLMALTAPAAHAANYVVDRTDDPNISVCTSASNDCSLRGAIAAANLSAGADEIRFDAALFPTKKTIKLTGTSLPKITGAVNIVAPDNGVILDGDNKSRIFAIDAGGNVTLSGLTLINGSAFGESFQAGKGGAIMLKNGVLRLVNCTLSNSKAIEGGGICNAFGTLQVIACTLNNNLASGNGGGISSSTVIGLLNTLLGSSTSLVNSTLSGNSAGGFGGGLFNGSGVTALDSVTITLNIAPNGKGGGVTSAVGVLGSLLAQTRVTNSILSANVGADVGSTVSGLLSLISGGHNILGINSNGLLSFLLNSDKGNIADVKLGVLSDNGGPTPTHALLNASVAIGNGLTALTVDQRGVIRVSTDIGSVTVGPIVVIPTPTPTPTTPVPTPTPTIPVPTPTPTTPVPTPTPTTPVPTPTPTTPVPTPTPTTPVPTPTPTTPVPTPTPTTPVPTPTPTTPVDPNLPPLGFGVSISPAGPKTYETITATPVMSNSTGVTFIYTFSVNGAPRQVGPQNTFDLSQAGNGDKHDMVTVNVIGVSATGQGGTSSNSVSIVNTAPFTFSGSVSTDADTEATFELRAGDADGDPLTFRRAGGPVHGTAEIKIDPTDGKEKLFYRSRKFYDGTDFINFVAEDDEKRTSNVATLAIDLHYEAPKVNRDPVAIDSGLDTYTGQAEVKALLASDADGDVLTYRVISNAKYGSSELRKDANGKWCLFYQSLPKFYGLDSVKYVAVDPSGRNSNIATISINFINRPPSADDANIAVASNQKTSVYIFGNDPDRDDLTFRLVNNPKFGTGEIKRDEQGNWRAYYCSMPGYAGLDQLTFVTVDRVGRTSNVATVKVDVRPTSPAPSGGNS